MAYDFKAFETRIKETNGWLSQEFSSIRTGRATPALLDTVRVDSYGAKVPINQVGSVNIEDPRTLRVTPWDSDSIQNIERAIIDADLGVSVSTDSAGLRVIFPELTSERREQLLKVGKAKLEEARVSLRAARDEEIKKIDQAEKQGGMGEDERFKAKEDLQKLVDAANAEFNTMFERKETEINQ